MGYDSLQMASSVFVAPPVKGGVCFPTLSKLGWPGDLLPFGVRAVVKCEFRA